MALPPPDGTGGVLFAARPSLIRAMNEQLLLEHIRQRGPCSRAELARVSGLSKPTVSLALENVERAGLVRIAGQRTGVPGRSARLYEIRPDAGLVLGLDIGHEYVRGAIADLSGEIRVRESLRAHATSVRGRVAELVGLADMLCENACVPRSSVTQTVIGSPGVYDPRRNAMKLTGGLRGWDRPAALAGLREAFGPSLVMENDVDAAALAARARGAPPPPPPTAARSITSRSCTSAPASAWGSSSAASSSAARTASPGRSRSCRLPAAPAPTSTRRASAGRWRRPPRRPGSSGPPGAAACAVRCPPGGSSSARPRVTSAPRRWWRKKRG
jgi:DNA-binding transcriptional ArsR family regulator